MFVNNNLSSFKSAYSKSVHQPRRGCLAMASEAAEEKGTIATGISPLLAA